MITTPLQHQSLSAYTNAYILSAVQYGDFMKKLWAKGEDKSTFMNGAGQGANFILKCLAYPYPLSGFDSTVSYGSNIVVANQTIATDTAVQQLVGQDTWTDWSPMDVEFLIDAGVPESYKLDFPYWYACSKHCSYKLYLPYIGYIEIDAFLGFISNLKIKYTIDATTGIGVCYVSGYDIMSKEYIPLVRQEFMAAFEIPLTGADSASISAMYRSASFANKTSAFGVLGGVASIAVGVGGLYASKGLSTQASIGMIMGGAATLAGSVAAGDKAKEDMISAQNYAPNMTGVSTDSGCALWSYHRVPYVVCEHNYLVRGDGYVKYYGYPCYKNVIIGDLTGYAEFNSVHVENTTATADEQAEIEQLLLAGVIING